MNIIPDLLQSAAQDIAFYGFFFILTLGIVIIIHEFGHYFAARLCNVHVEKFSFGFGKEFFGFGRKGQTRWSVGTVPVGGYVQLFGDVDINNPVVWDHENNCARTLSQEELKISYCTKSVWQRIFIVGAGPAINVLFTLILYIALFSTYGQRSYPLEINAVAVNSAAHTAGIKTGDTILTMDGKQIRRLEDIYDHTFYEVPPKPHIYKILRNGEILDIEFAAQHISYTDHKGVSQSHGQTGMVRMGQIELKHITSINDVSTKDNTEKARTLIIRNLDKEISLGLPFKDEEIHENEPYLITFPKQYNAHLTDPNHEHFDKAMALDPDAHYFVRLDPKESVIRTLYWMKTVLINSYKLISVAYKGKTDEPVIGGVSKIFLYSAVAVKQGFYDYLMFLGAFSLMIAIINLLPIPALDGGYLIFLTYEAIRGKPLSPRIQNAAIVIGLAFLVGIMIIANVSDLISLLSPLKSN